MSLIEVEAKYPLSEPFEVWRQRLVSLGAAVVETVDQCDEYFAHPCRDFVATGEAFRIRTVGNANAMTYKGPLLDPHTKSRRESELEFAAGPESVGRMQEILLALGFQPAGRVPKRRTTLTIERDGTSITLSLDEVTRLGAFLEIEIVADESDWTSVRDAVLAFAAELGLGQSERRSYLELLLSKEA